MTKTKKRINAKALALLAVLTAAITLAACAAPATDYPEEALATNTPQMIGLRSYVSSTETPMTLTATDAFRKATNAEIAMIDAAGFPEPEKDEDKNKAVIEAGYVTRAQLAYFFPEGRELVTVTMTGAEIKNIADNNVDAILSQTEKNKADPSYMHFSGVAFVYNKKNVKYMRIVDSSVATEEETAEKVPLDDKRAYSVALTTETAKNLKISEEKYVQRFGESLDAVCAFIEEHGVVAGQQRFVDKADLDAPMITLFVLIGIAVAVLAAIIAVYFVMKNKQKQAKKRRGGEPRIDV